MLRGVFCYYISMRCSSLFFTLVFLVGSNLPARAGFPFSFRKAEIKTDYSQTVWDRIMQEQSMLDMRRGMGEMAAANYQAASNSFARAVIKNSKERINYERQVDAGPWKGFPLAELMRTPLPKNGQAMQLTDRENRVRFHKEYADLMKREPCQYDSNQKVSRPDVVDYINILCEYGDQIKPKATKKYDCSKMYSDGTHHQKIVDCPDGNC